MTNESDAPEPTDEQRAAVEWLQHCAGISSKAPAHAHARVLLATLPASLTNPQPALPTEPGWYIGRDDSTWRCTDGVIRCLVSPGRKAQDFAPFTRLVPERPQVTKEQIREVVTREWFNVRGTENMTEQIDALLNGTRDK